MDRIFSLHHAWRGLTPAVACALLSFAAPLWAQVPESWTVRIDAATTQPVVTGFVPTNDDGEVIFLAEGALRPVALPDRLDQGWFGPSGQTNFLGSGTPIGDGMPYGALVGGGGLSIPQYQYLGRIGSFDLQPADVGTEFRLALNLSDAQLASMEGEITVTIVYVPQGSAEVSQLVLKHDTVLPALTGLMVESGDQFIILPYGALLDPVLANSAYTGGYFGPEGLLGLVTPLQPLPDGPYGSLLASFAGLPGAFNVCDGGVWSTQPSDVGQEVELLLNVDAAAQAGLTGKFVVNVIRIPEPDITTVDDGSSAAGDLLGAFPNPSSGASFIRFRLDRDEFVRLRVYDTQGRVLRTLAAGPRVAGTYAVAWDGRDESGRRAPAGTYFYQLSGQRGSRTGKLALVN